MTTQHCQHPIPWTGINSCHFRIWDLAVRTIGWCSLKRPWLAQRPSYIGQKKPSHWPQVSLANWQECVGAQTCYWTSGHIYQCGGLDDTPPSNLVKITSSTMTEPTLRECSHSRILRPHTRGSFLRVHFEKWSQAMTTTQTTSQPAAPAQEVEPKQENTIQWWPSPLGSVEITWSLHGDNPSWMLAVIPLELVEDQSPLQMRGPPCSLPDCFRMQLPEPCMLIWSHVQWTW